MPAMAKVLAESPSVRIKVQFYAFLVPASLASSNLTNPKIRVDFVPFSLLAILLNNFDLA